MDVMYAGFAGAKTGVLLYSGLPALHPSGHLRFALMFTKIDWINFEHHVLYDGLTRQGKVSYRDVANNIAPGKFVTPFE